MIKCLSRGKILLLASVMASSTFIGSINVSASTAFTGVRDIPSQQIVNEMKVGWNLGNTMDATGGETNWGNPITTHAMIDKIKAAGFNTLRLPVTWDGHMGAAPEYTIDQSWMKRVEEIANYAFDNDMYVIINIHHENDWLKPFYANQTQVTAQLTKVWTQIANNFKQYGDHLIFETMNEPRPVGAATEWSGGTAENRDVVNKYNLAAVNAIRATGGNNATRFVMVPTLAATSQSIATDALIIPNNDSRVIVSLHMYSPYYFAMDINGTSSWGSDSDKSSLDSEFDAVYNKFVKNGRAVVIGEMGSINKNNTASRVTHAEYYAKSAKARGLTPIWWDNGYSVAGKAESFGIFNRTALTWDAPEVMSAFIKGAGGTSSTTTPTVTKVEVPTFSVAAGTYSTTQTVALSNNTSGATVYYTTDGSTPTTSSAVYSSAITVSKTTTIKAIAVKSGMTNSDVASATYTISTSTTTPVASGIEVTYAVANNWGSGASINITIKNNGTTPINGWNLVWALPSGQTITSLWSAGYTTSGSTVTATNASYNGAIAANGGTQSFGFNINYSGTLIKPTSIKLNGTECTVK